jgi:hypothetical protein
MVIAIVVSWNKGVEGTSAGHPAPAVFAKNQRVDSVPDACHIATGKQGGRRDRVHRAAHGLPRVCIWLNH